MSLEFDWGRRFRRRGRRRRSALMRAIDREAFPVLSTFASSACILTTRMRRRHRVDALCDLEPCCITMERAAKAKEKDASFEHFAATGLFDCKFVRLLLPSSRALSLARSRALFVSTQLIANNRSSRRSTSTSGVRRTRSGKRPRRERRRRHRRRTNGRRGLHLPDGRDHRAQQVRSTQRPAQTGVAGDGRGGQDDQGRWSG